MWCLLMRGQLQQRGQCYNTTAAVSAIPLFYRFSIPSASHCFRVVNKWETEPPCNLCQRTPLQYPCSSSSNIHQSTTTHTQTEIFSPGIEPHIRTILLADKPLAVSPPFLLCASESSHLSQIICFSGCLVNRQLSNVHVGRHTVSVYGHRHFIFTFISYLQSWLGLLASLENYNSLHLFGNTACAYFFMREHLVWRSINVIQHTIRTDGHTYLSAFLWRPPKAPLIDTFYQWQQW